jgi:hypothetical protein
MNNKTVVYPMPLNYSFTAPIGISIKGEIWACVEVPGSAELFGTKRGVRVDAEVDGIALPNVALLVTGPGGHMLSLNAKLRKQLGKDIGDPVTIHLSSWLK